MQIGQLCFQGAAWTDNEHELDKWRCWSSLPLPPRQWVGQPKNAIFDGCSNVVLLVDGLDWISDISGWYVTTLGANNQNCKKDENELNTALEGCESMHLFFSPESESWQSIRQVDIYQTELTCLSLNLFHVYSVKADKASGWGNSFLQHCAKHCQCQVTKLKHTSNGLTNFNRGGRFKKNGSEFYGTMRHN